MQEEHREIQLKECAEDLQRYNNLLAKLGKEDEDFFEYAHEVLNECSIGGRPVYPIKKAIHVSSALEQFPVL